MIAFHQLDGDAEREWTGLRSISGSRILQEIPLVNTRLDGEIWDLLWAECGEMRPIDPEKVDPVKAGILDELDTLCSPTTPGSPYTVPLASLKIIMSHPMGPDLIGTLFCFTRGLDASFSQLLKIKEPRAILVLLH